MLRIGMLTSGGDCQALNAAMRGVVKGICSKRDDVEIYGFKDRKIFPAFLQEAERFSEHRDSRLN